jgi:hypothetical protein
MAGCENINLGGNKNWGLERVLLGWGGLGATLGAAASLTFLSSFWVGVLGALAGYVIGVGVGFAVEWFSRLVRHNPGTITISGMIICAGKNTGFPPFHDNDWTFNVGNLTVTDPTTLSVDEVKTRVVESNPAFPSIDASTRKPILHCEIGSRMGDGGALGGAIGTVGGAIAGGLIAAAIGCAVLGAFTFGLGCLLAILVGILIGAIVGLVAGNAVGVGIGWIADELSDFDKKGKAISQGCMMFLTGSWVNDKGHQHNEIHDIERAVIIECGISSSKDMLTFSAAVGIGRHPQDRDP